jgi:hypothetical protein
MDVVLMWIFLRLAAMERDKQHSDPPRMTSESRDSTVEQREETSHNASPYSGVRWLKRFIDADHHNIEGRPFAATVKEKSCSAPEKSADPRSGS